MTAGRTHGCERRPSPRQQVDHQSHSSQRRAPDRPRDAVLPGDLHQASARPGSRRRAEPARPSLRRAVRVRPQRRQPADPAPTEPVLERAARDATRSAEPGRRRRQLEPHRARRLRAWSRRTSSTRGRSRPPRSRTSPTSTASTGAGSGLKRGTAWAGSRSTGGRASSRTTRQCAGPSTGPSTGRTMRAPRGLTCSHHGPTSCCPASPDPLRGRASSRMARARTWRRHARSPRGTTRTGGSWWPIGLLVRYTAQAEIVRRDLTALGLDLSKYGAQVHPAATCSPTWDILASAWARGLYGVCYDIRCATRPGSLGGSRAILGRRARSTALKIQKANALEGSARLKALGKLDLEIA